jgi:tight adherence protein C
MPADIAALLTPQTLVITLMALGSLASFGFVLAQVMGSGQAQRLKERLGARTAASGKAVDDNHGRSILDVLTKLGRNAMPVDKEATNAIRMRLVNAGILGRNAVAWYYAARLMCVVLPQIALLFALPWVEAQDWIPVPPVGVSLLVAIIGLAAPDSYLNGRVEKRRDEYRSGFPDMMDLLVACVEAGLGIDAAIGRVAEEMAPRYPNLAAQLRLIALELRAGRSRQQAWANFARRTALAEAGTLATMLRQAEEMGSSLGQTLRVFSGDMREKRILRAEEKALALPAKMTVPLILFVFPTLLGVLMMPAVIRMIEVFKGMEG